jgi:hypothetical protein
MPGGTRTVKDEQGNDMKSNLYATLLREIICAEFERACVPDRHPLPGVSDQRALHFDWTYI